MIEQIQNATDETRNALAKAGEEIAEAGRTVLNAGLGAVATAEEKSRSLFDRLVDKGRPVADKQKAALDRAAERANRFGREFQKLIADTVEYEVKGAFTRFGLATREDVNALSVRIEALAQKIDELDIERN